MKKKVFPLGAIISMPKVEGQNVDVQIETTSEWLLRMAKECNKEMPLLKTQIKKADGTIKKTKINWLARLIKLHELGGKEKVRKYLVAVVQDYNLKLTHIKKQTHAR